MQTKTYRYVILGGGVVAGYAAQEFGQLGIAPGDLAIVSADPALPYERPSLSKDFLAGESKREDILINAEQFYRDHGIDLWLGTQVTRADLVQRVLHTRDEMTIGFEQLLIATGSSPRTLDISGADHDRVHYLRSLDDSTAIRNRIDRLDQAAVIGGGYIGMEVAAVLASQQVETSIITHSDRLLPRVFNPELSEFFASYYRDRGVEIYFNDEPAYFTLDRNPPGVALNNRSLYIPAQSVLVGVGVTPRTELFSRSGLELDNGILVNEYLETNIDGVYAAGDIARYPDAFYHTRRRVEHWQNAVDQGRHAARVMLGRRKEFQSVPYFFSDMFDLSWEFWGDPGGAHMAITRGSFEDASIGVWWVRDEHLIAAFLLNRSEAEREIAQHLTGQALPFAENMLEDDNKQAFRALNA
jgi:3-phenylpropionate/trans-cinnamate dioxygenase ferredoxin reductase subunit